MNGKDGFILYEWNTETKEFYFLGHKIDYVNSPSEWLKYLNDLVTENKELKSENQKYKEVIDKLRADLNLLIKYGDGEEASRWDKQYGEFAKNHLKYMDELLKEVK